MARSRGLFGGVIVLYFIIALEVLIMISPFAAFFYAVFNPVLLFLAHWPATRWLAAFFLPHMVLPPGLFLQTIRVVGSVLFVAGTVVFFACAAQVYFHKLFRHDPALGGLYRWIRHPQYVALGAAGLGLAILWPRFLTIVLWTVMVALYYLLARDEERRMIKQFGDQYRSYVDSSGRFLPRPIEQAVSRLPLPGTETVRPVLGFILLLAVTVGCAFGLRSYTVRHLPLWSQGRITVLAILPADSMMLQNRMAAALELPEVQSRLASVPDPVLVYLVPQRYVMQGMIADTEPQWRLYEHHQTLAMIADWIFHPFRHLQGGGHMMMQHSAAARPSGDAAPGEPAPGAMAPDAMVRRLIFLQLEGSHPSNARSFIFGITTTRVPLFFADVDMHNTVLLQVHPLGPGTGWGDVPTPMF